MARLTATNAWVEFPVPLSKKRAITTAQTGGTIDPTRNVVVALSDISLDLRDGDRLGLIGHNGAGKSTLLRLLAGAYAPTRGQVRTIGRISTLFHALPGLSIDGTGRENIVSCGLHLGMSRRQIAQRTEEIVEFSELGSYIDLPARIYSAGMMTRLGFSIATAVEPEILLLDEGLATGDAQFARKAELRLTELMARSSILVIASHSESLIASMCTRSILLEHGRIVADGRANETVDFYRQSVIAAAENDDPDSLHRAYVLANEMVKHGQSPPAALEEHGLRYALQIHPDDPQMLARYIQLRVDQGKAVPPETEARWLVSQLAADPSRDELAERLACLCEEQGVALPDELRARAGALVPAGGGTAADARERRGV